MPLADEGRSCSGSRRLLGYRARCAGEGLRRLGRSCRDRGTGQRRRLKTYEQLPPNVCQFAIVMDDIPDGGDGIYGVEVANRGVINFKKRGLQRHSPDELGLTASRWDT